MYVTLIIIVIIFSFLLATSYYFFALAIKRGNKEKILNQPHNKTTYQPNEKRMEKEKLWYQKNNEEVWLVSQDNLKLFGVKIKNSLSKREYEIIKLRYGLCGNKPLTQREVAQKLGISRSYISRLETKAMETIKGEIEKKNIFED